MSAKYREIADDLRRRIEAGEWIPGTTLPDYASLVEEYGVGRGVISSALAILKAEGLISVVKRRGITVRERGNRRRLKRGTLVTRDPARGYVMPAATSPDEPWQVHGRPSRETLPIPERPAELLRLEPGTLTLRRRRVTSPTGDPPFQLVDTWVHPQAVADAPRVADRDTGRGGYLDRLEEAGHGPIAWMEYMRARMPTPEEARQVDMPDTMPALELARVGTSARTNAPIEVTICVIPADRVEIATELKRARSAQWPLDSPDSQQAER
ncbi:GntR family transcriptional regulator [Actinomadura namibiensis]|uniref:GntR family transcriptional regulator n=1 Tax=Actinomadura namibiensis TaxID=182080 RepID=A0A7W3M0P1_ACTNM|nr:GntR family transcriptional regulator [Actinomadura namibiensis]MBA8957714.1 GntR family transcriptional regulator [Actinomadura namibiensis]